MAIEPQKWQLISNFNQINLAYLENEYHYYTCNGGGDGNDELSSGSGDDLIAGESGYDVIEGLEGSDRLFGGPEQDQDQVSDLLDGNEFDPVFLLIVALEEIRVEVTRYTYLQVAVTIKLIVKL